MKLLQRFIGEYRILADYGLACSGQFDVSVSECSLQLALPECQSIVRDLQQSVIRSHLFAMYLTRVDISSFCYPVATAGLSRHSHLAK